VSWSFRALGARKLPNKIRICDRLIRFQRYYSPCRIRAVPVFSSALACFCYFLWFAFSLTSRYVRLLLTEESPAVPPVAVSESIIGNAKYVVRTKKKIIAK
jgi:hypothetical protein